MSTNDTDHVGYQTRTVALPSDIESGRNDLHFLRLISFTYPASPLTIVQYSIGAVEQERGLRLDLDKMAFLDRYAEDAEQERSAAKAIVSFLASNPPEVLVAKASGD